MDDRELGELERLANAATKGPWKASVVSTVTSPNFVRRWGNVEAESDRVVEMADAPDAAFIAAANPETIKALVAEVRRLRAIVADLADSCPCQPGLEFDYRCRMCKIEMYNQESHDLDKHTAECPWRRAVEAVKR